MDSTYSKRTLKQLLKERLEIDFRTDFDSATNAQFYKAISLIVVDYLKEKRSRFMAKMNSEGRKQAYYISMEFLMGRSLKTNLYNLGFADAAREMFADLGIDIENIYDNEPDAGLGNGGLGRLAACYLDGLASTDYPMTGYSILYEYGIFKQQIIDGWQTELPDNWLPGGGVWLVPVPDQAIDVRLGGEIEERWEDKYHHITHKNYSTVKAIPYDMYVSGYKSHGVSKLRLWKAEALSFDMNLFISGEYARALGANDVAHAISKVLYPNDNHLEGKSLRLRQQYFMCAAAIGDIVMRHMRTYGTLDNLHEKAAIHINDTHPTLAIPELMRVLIDDCGYEWDKAWNIVTKTFAYTNHTVMSEALEVWDKNLMEEILPRILSIIVEINNRYCKEIFDRTHDSDKTSRLSIILDNQVKMANLCIAASYSVNGVSKLHSDIIKNEVFAEQAELEPEKFRNVTNGIAYRRWLLQSNPNLTNLLTECIGDGFKKDANELAKFATFKDDAAVIDKLAVVKKLNKERFAKYVKNKMGIEVNIDSIFDVQVKRLHEYKRQHLNALNIIAEYNYIRENPNAPFQPKTYIFAAKAAPGYYLAKQIIKMIWSIGEQLRKDPVLSKKLSVIYLEDYNVTMSEVLMPASEFSEQISLAGTEASGTGNMKLMLNGALTIGTYDGANVEISEQVGAENFIEFGMRKEEVIALKGMGYSPEKYYEENDVIKNAISQMYSGINGANFSEVADNLRFKDDYMVLADFADYQRAQKFASECYANKSLYGKMSVSNIAGAGIFSADRAVTDYAKEIWNL